MKTVKLTLAIFLTALLAIACTQPDKKSSGLNPKIAADYLGSADDLAVTDAEVAKAKENLGGSVIGLIPCTMANEYHFAAADAARKTLEAKGFTVRLVDPETKSDRQIAAIENLTAAGAKVIVMCVLDPKVVSQAMKQAADKGVWFVQFAGCEPGLHGIGISIDDADLGRAAGKFAANLINRDMSGSAKVVILDYPDLPNAVARADAIESALKELAPGAVIVGRFQGGTREKGLASLEAALQANPDINVVVSINDAGAYGAMMALKAAGKDPAKTVVVGIDAEKEALNLVKEGGMYRGTVDTQPARTGELAAEAAIKMASGSAVPERVRVPIKVVSKEGAE